MLVYIYCMIVDVHVFLKPWLDMCLLLALQQGAMSWVLDILVLAHTTHQSSQSPGPSAGCHVWSTRHTRPSTHNAPLMSITVSTLRYSAHKFLLAVSQTQRDTGHKSLILT